MLPRDETEPGGKVAASLEGRHRRRKGPDRRGGDRPHPRHALKTLHRLIVLGGSPQSLVEFRDLGAKAGNVFEGSLAKLAHERME
jgi:hypothetical protein